MKDEFKCSQINDCCLKLLTELRSVFENASSAELDCIKDYIYLPDQKNTLYKSSDLSYNDADWTPVEEGCVQVSMSFSKELATRLGVKLTRSKFSEQFVSPDSPFTAIEFGQHEKITTRLRNIIRDYPLDITLLKELLQNADDAKANKMYVVLDKRSHGKQSVLSEEWKELQGPALLVWNDSTFTEKDLRGIQELGLRQQER